MVLMAGVALGAAAAFLLVAHDRSQRAVEALGKAYEASVPKEEMPVVQALPLENPPQVSAGSPGIPAAQQEAANPVQDETASNASLWVSKDTPPAPASVPEGASRAVSGEGASRAASREGASRAVPFLGVRCENREDGAYVVELWPNSGWDRAFLILGGTPPEPFGIHKPTLPAMLGALYNTCDDLGKDLAHYKPGQEYHIDLFDGNYPARSEYVVRLIERPLAASKDWF